MNGPAHQICMGKNQLFMCTCLPTHARKCIHTWVLADLPPCANGTSVSTVTGRAQVRSTRLLTNQDDLPPQTYMRTVRYLQTSQKLHVLGPLSMKLTIQNPPCARAGK